MIGYTQGEMGEDDKIWRGSGYHGSVLEVRVFIVFVVQAEQKSFSYLLRFRPKSSRNGLPQPGLSVDAHPNMLLALNSLDVTFGSANRLCNLFNTVIRQGTFNM